MSGTGCVYAKRGIVPTMGGTVTRSGVFRTRLRGCVGGPIPDITVLGTFPFLCLCVVVSECGQK